MPVLADAMNTWDLALELIHRKGFTVSSHGSDDPDLPSGWEAVDSHGNILAADSPLALLALCDIWIEWGEKWKTVDIRSWYEDIIDSEDI